MNQIVRDWITDMPTVGDKLLAFIAYIGGNPGGGLLFPAAYGLLLWRAWDAPGLTSGWRWIVVGLGVGLTVVSIFYPAALRRYFNRRSAELNALRDAFHVYWGSLTAEPPDKLRSVKAAMEKLATGLR